MSVGPDGGAAHKRRPSFRGQLVQRTYRGREVSQAWPPGRGRALAAKTREQMEFFRQVQWAFKYQDPVIQRNYADAVRGSPLLPRDLYLSAMAGRMLAFRTPEGRLIVSVPANNDVSETLDFLSSVPGTILYRSPTGWIGLEPTEAGDVLSLAGDPLLPGWGPTAGGSPIAQAIAPPAGGQLALNSAGTFGTATTIVLCPCFPQVATIVNRIKWTKFVTTTTTPTLKPLIYDMGDIDDMPESTSGATLVGQGPEYSPLTKGLHSLDFTTPVTLTAGRVYLIGVFKKGATANYLVVQGGAARARFTTTTAYTDPPATLPAMSQTVDNAHSFWTE